MMRKLLPTAGSGPDRAALLLSLSATVVLAGCGVGGTGSGLSGGEAGKSKEATLALRAQAFRAYVNQDYAKSEQLYQQVLNQLSTEKEPLAFANTSKDLARVRAEAAEAKDAAHLSQSHNAESAGAAGAGMNGMLQKLFPEALGLSAVNSLRSAIKYESGGNWQAAVQLLEEAAETKTMGRLKSPKGSDDHAGLYRGLLLDEASHIARAHADWKTAARLTRAGKAVYDKALWTEHPSALRNRVWLASVALSANEPQESARLIKAEYDKYGVRLPGPSRPELVDCLVNLAVCQDPVNEKYAFSVSQAAYELASRPPALEPVKLSSLCLGIGDRQYRLKKDNPELCLPWYERSLSVLKDNPGTAQDVQGLPLLRIGMMEFMMGKRAASRIHVEQARPLLIAAHRQVDADFAAQLLGDIDKMQAQDAQQRQEKGAP